MIVQVPAVNGGLPRMAEHMSGTCRCRLDARNNKSTFATPWRARPSGIHCLASGSRIRFVTDRIRISIFLVPFILLVRSFLAYDGGRDVFKGSEFKVFLRQFLGTEYSN
jgi:hypothetical protein